MAVIDIRSDRVVVHFSWWERLMVRRAQEVVPLAAVTGTEVRTHWSYRPMGARAGVVVAGLLKAGTWRSPGSSRLVCIRRGLPTLRVGIDRNRSGSHFDELLIGTRGAEAAAAALGAGASGQGKTEPR